MIFRNKWADVITSRPWAFVAFITDKIGWVTRYKIREVRQFDDYAWRRATEPKGK